MKDPAFLLYFKNFLSDTRHWDNETKGVLITLWCEQADNGSLDWDLIKKICGPNYETIWKTIKHRFKEDENGKFFDIEHEERLEKRRGYVKSRIENRWGKKKCSISNRHRVDTINKNINENKDVSKGKELTEKEKNDLLPF